MALTCADVDFELKLAEFKINGYTVFEDMIPLETIDRIRAAFLTLLENVQNRHREVTTVETGDVRTGKGCLATTNRYTVTIPWAAPFADPAIYEHPVILEFLDRYWQAANYLVTCYHSNTPCSGSAFQVWHRDTNLAAEIPHVCFETVPALGVKFPLVDTSEENGSFEVLPATQYLVDPAIEGRQKYDDILRQGDFPSIHRLNLKKGSMWIQDPRTLHRGTPNRSPDPRPELVVCYCRDWYVAHDDIQMPQAAYESLSEKGRHMLRRYDRVEWS